MEEKKNKVDKLEQLVGEENAKLLRAKILAESELLYSKIAELTASYSGDMRQKMLNELTSCGTWSEEAQNSIMDLLRTKVIDNAVHELLMIAGSLQASAPVEMSDYARHALVHYEEGIKAVHHHDLRDSMNSLLRSLVVAEPQTPAPETPPV